MTNGNFMLAIEQVSVDPESLNMVSEMQTIVFDNNGEVLYPANPVSDLIPAEDSVWEREPAMAAAPNGETGLLWVREVFQSDLGFTTQKLVFAILDETGEPVYGPLEITNNTTLGLCYSGEDSIPCYYHLQLAVADDGGYAIAFQQWISEAGVDYVNIFFGTRNPDGSEQTPLVNLSRGVTGLDNYFPSLTSLAGNQFFLAWNGSSLTYTAFDSRGAVIQPITMLGSDLRSLDSSQLSDGAIFIAGMDWNPEGDAEMSYIILDPTSFTVSTPKTPLPYAYGSGTISGVSVSPDRQAHAIITWKYPDDARLVYALVGSDGQVVTPPLAFRDYYGSLLETNNSGYANTTYLITVAPFSRCDAVVSIPESECLALQALYTATDGAAWKIADGWLESGDLATWYGVTVADRHVTRLELADNNLYGSIPPELSDLTYLEVLDLQGNQLTGEIPSTLGSLVNILVFTIANNNLEGDIPESLTQLTELCEPGDDCGDWDQPYGLDLGYNRLNVPAATPTLASFLALKDPDWYLTQGVEETFSGDIGGTLVSNDGRVQITIPPGAFTGQATFLLEPVQYLNYSPGNLLFAGVLFDLNAFDILGESLTTFAQPLIFTIYYAGAFSEEIPEESLRLYYNSEFPYTWQDVASTCGGGEVTRNLDEDWLSVPVCHLSLYALMGAPTYQIFLPFLQR